MARRSWGLALLVGALVLPQTVAWAEVEETGTQDRARALFEEGLRLADQEQWVQASDRFRRSLALRPSPAVRLNLASSLSRQGFNGEAVDHLEEVIDNEDAPANVRQLAEELFGRLTTQTARVAIELAGVSGLVVVTLDGEALPEWRWRGLLHVEPGPHLLVVSANGSELLRRELVVRGGGSEAVRYHGQGTEGTAEDQVASAASPEGSGASAETAGAESESPSAAGSNEEEGAADPVPQRRRRRWIIPVAVGGGVVVAAAVVLGVVFGVQGGNDDIVEGNMEPGVWTWR